MYQRFPAVVFTHAYNRTNQRVLHAANDNTWLAWPGPPGTTAYTANALNQYTAVGAAAPTHDNRGNLTFDGTFTYARDSENRLATVAQGATTIASYAWDAAGRRKTKTVGAATTIFVTDADNREVLEYDGATGQTLRWHAHGVGANDPLAQHDVPAGIRLALVPDIQGSIVATMASTTGVLAKVAYAPFGQAATPPASFGYTGQRVDPETNGLYYYRARHYSPTLGRFLQPDPAGYGDGLHLYVYARNDPLNLVDPSGREENAAIPSMQLIPAFTNPDSGLANFPVQAAPSVPSRQQIGQNTAAGLGLLATISLQFLPAAGEALPQPQIVPGNPDGNIELASGSRKLNCQNVDCGAPTGGVVYPLCPTCNDRLKNGGPPILLETRNGWPVDPATFVARIAREWLDDASPIMPIVRRVFGEG